MPANLPPAYREAEQKYRSAKGPAQKVAALQQLLSAIPKHKGTDHLRADLRSKLSRATEELENPKRSGGASQYQPYAIRREGAGQAVLIGLPNAGKSQLMAALTSAAAKVGDYPFTTQVPLPGMLRYQNVLIQMVDTPAINDNDVQTRLFSLLRNSDLLLIVVDLSGDPLSEVEEVMDELERWGYRLLHTDEEADPEDPKVQKHVLLVGNKADLPDTDEGFEMLQELYDNDFGVVAASAADDDLLAKLGKAVFVTLHCTRVYLKAPGGKPDYESPLIVETGSSLEEAAHYLHKDWARKVKYALLWGSGKFDGQRVGREYILQDEDVIELHG